MRIAGAAGSLSKDTKQQPLQTRGIDKGFLTGFQFFDEVFLDFYPWRITPTAARYNYAPFIFTAHSNFALRLFTAQKCLAL